MAHVIIDSSGIGATQVGTVITAGADKFVTIVNETNTAISLDLHEGVVIGAGKDTGDIKINANDFLILEHAGGVGSYSMQKVKTTHGTSAVVGQNAQAGGNLDVRVYMYKRG